MTEAVDFTVTDLNGNEHTLSDYLDAGKYVCIDFFALLVWTLRRPRPLLHRGLQHVRLQRRRRHLHEHGVRRHLGPDPRLRGGQRRDNPAPAISGAEGGRCAVHGDYSIQAFPTFILIDPEWNVVEQDIWPMSVEILDDVLQSYGLEQMTCVSSIEDEATVTLDGVAEPGPRRPAGRSRSRNPARPDRLGRP